MCKYEQIVQKESCIVHKPRRDILVEYQGLMAQALLFPVGPQPLAKVGVGLVQGKGKVILEQIWFRVDIGSAVTHLDGGFCC